MSVKDYVNTPNFLYYSTTIEVIPDQQSTQFEASVDLILNRLSNDYQ